MIDVIIFAVLLVILGGVAFYVYKAKKSGVKCVGCPQSKQCGSKCNCGSSEKTE